MKVIFICGSLEPGHDGVGDYTRRLACEFIRQGNQAELIAMNDQFIQKDIEGYQQDEGIGVRVLRISGSSEETIKFKTIENWLKNYQPDWISLQFVPFSFHPKGLPFRLAKFLLSFGKDIRWHIMFHELWIGMHKGAGKKELFWGFFQRIAIKSLLDKIKPKMISTQSGLYKTQLMRLGYESELLPLFSNIPVMKTDLIQNQKDKLVFILFGGIHDTGAPLEQFAKEVKAWSVKTKKPVSLKIIGRTGKEQNIWKKVWEEKGMEIEIIGEKPSKEISEHLQMADYGITTTVFEKVDKSGSVAAMIEHGLNVICISGLWEPRDGYRSRDQEGVLDYKEGVLEGFFRSERKPVRKGVLQEVASNLARLFTLNQISNN